MVEKGEGEERVTDFERVGREDPIVSTEVSGGKTGEVELDLGMMDRSFFFGEGGREGGEDRMREMRERTIYIKERRKRKTKGKEKDVMISKDNLFRCLPPPFLLSLSACTKDRPKKLTNTKEIRKKKKKKKNEPHR